MQQQIPPIKMTKKAEICYINKDTKEMETKKATKTNYIISR